MKLKELSGNARNTAKQALLTASKHVWRAPLTRASSIERLQASSVAAMQAPPVHVPAQRAANGGPVQHQQEVRTFLPDYVWQLTTESAAQSLTVCRSGGVLLDRKWLLDLDFTSTAGLLDSPIKKKRDQHPLVIAPWAHFWRGFYDYVTFVVTKLCRIEEVYGPQIWQQAKICYPLQGTRYERDILQKLGIPESALIDTTPYWGTAIEADCVIVANSHESWCASPTDMQLLRERFRLPKEQVATPKKRIYLSRKGRRRVLNEEAILPMLRQYDFDIIEDKSYSIDEQIQLFQSASVVVAPHGAALTNLLWCDESTQVLEFFSNGYSPNYYQYLCTVLGLSYSFLVDYSAGEVQQEYHWANMTNDLVVDPDTLKKQLDLMLGEQDRVN